MGTGHVCAGRDGGHGPTTDLEDEDDGDAVLALAE